MEGVVLVLKRGRTAGGGGKGGRGKGCGDGAVWYYSYDVYHDFAMQES